MGGVRGHRARRGTGGPGWGGQDGTPALDNGFGLGWLGVVGNCSLAPGVMEVGRGWAGPRWARRPNTRNRLFPAMGAEGAGAGPGQGAPGDPSLVFSERLNRNPLADGWLPPRADLQDPGPRPEWAPGPASSLLLGGPAATHPLHRAPHGGMKVQTGRGRHGGGVLQDVRHWRGRGVPRTRPRAAPGGGVPSLAGGARRWGGWGA